MMESELCAVKVFEGLTGRRRKATDPGEFLNALAELETTPVSVQAMQETKVAKLAKQK